MSDFYTSKYSKKLEIMPFANFRSSYETLSKLMTFSSSFTGDRHIGLQVVPTAVGFDLFAVSDTKSYLDDGDINWIFRTAAQEGTHQLREESAFAGGSRKVYALCGLPPHKSIDFDNEGRFQREHLDDLLVLLSECGAMLQVVFGKGKATLLVSIPGVFPRRLRSMLTVFFNCSAIKPAGRLTKEDIKSDKSFLRLFSQNLILHLAHRASVDSMQVDDPDLTDSLDDLDLDDDTDIADGPEEEEVPKDDSPSLSDIKIESMNLSIRTFNALKRAGINTAQQLSEMTGDELMRVRLLGVKGVEEVREKLREIKGSLKDAPEHKSYLEQLDSLVGLDDVKEQVRKIVAYARMKKDFEAKGMDHLSIALNMVFVGNPGTAKTTVARILAGIFYEIGLVEHEDLIEVGRGGLVGEYVGKTALKVEDLFKKANGRVLFIDEAYSLVDCRDNSFGDEAINTLVQQMENNRDRTIVILAGYPDKMEEFLARNPGLKSRVPFQVGFKDYKAEDLVRITTAEASRYGFSVAPDACGKLQSLCEKAAGNPEAGNGRFCRNLVEHALIEYAARVYGTESGEEKADPVLIASDLAMPLNLKTDEAPKRKIGFV